MSFYASLYIFKERLQNTSDVIFFAFPTRPILFVGCKKNTHILWMMRGFMKESNIMKKEFKVYSPLTQKSVEKFITKKQTEEQDDTRLLLEGIASTSNRDLHNEIVSPEAIQSMVKQAETLNIHADHFYGISDVIGAIQKATLTEEGSLMVKFLITKKYTPIIQDLLDTGVKLGLSIGGYIEEYDEKNQLIKQIRLHEISLTAMPANWDTFGTVNTTKGVVESNCITGACYELIKKNEVNIMEPIEQEATKAEEVPVEVEALTEEKVIELINEYMAEKEETIAQEITDKVESQLESIVEAKVQELIEEPEEETEADVEVEVEAPTETEAKAEPTEEDEEEEEAAKSITPDFSEIITASIEKALGDDFADKVASKMFGKLDENRTTTGSKFEQYTKSIDEVEEEPVEKTTYSTAEASQILLAKQQQANPIVAAAMKNLK